MKNVFLLVLLCIFGCSDNEIKESNFDNGSWKMVSYTAFAPEITKLNGDDVVWTFNPKKESLIIDNQIELTHPFLKTSGTYSYSLVSETAIKIDGTDFSYRIKKNELTLSNDAQLDGPLIKFVRID